MEISIATPLTDPEWDTSVAAFPDATPFHTAAWARVIHDSYGFAPCYFVASDSSGIRAIQPMMEVKTWATRRRGVSLPFTDECGLLTHAREDARDLAGAILDHAGRRGWRSVEYRGTRPSSSEPAPGAAFVRHVLNLRPGLAALNQGLESSNRRAIRKAEKDGVEVTLETSRDAMVHFYTLQEITRRRHGLPPQPWPFFEAVHRHMVETGRGFVALARFAGEIVAGAVFFLFARRAVYKFGASDERFQQHRPNNLVMWRAIEHLHALGAQDLNFGRSSTHHEGLRAFKLSWGAVESPLNYTIVDTRTGRERPVDDGPSLAERLSPVFRHCPPTVSRWAGRLLYRHMA